MKYNVERNIYLLSFISFNLQLKVDITLTLSRASSSNSWYSGSITFFLSPSNANSSVSNKPWRDTSNMQTQAFIRSPPVSSSNRAKTVSSRLYREWELKEYRNRFTLFLNLFKCYHMSYTYTYFISVSM